MAIIGGDVTEQITIEVDLFESILQQNVIENEFTREYAPLATIQLHLWPLNLRLRVKMTCTWT